MKESYSEGLANHAGLRSYAGIRKCAGGTLIEVRAGRVLSREMKLKNTGRRRCLSTRKAKSAAANAYVADEPREV